METLRGHSDEVKLGNFVSKMMGSRLSEACLVGTPNCQSRGVFVILWPYLWGSLLCDYFVYITVYMYILYIKFGWWFQRFFCFYPF